MRRPRGRRWLQAVHCPLKPVRRRIPARLSRAVAVVIVIKLILIEQSRAQGIEHHLGTGRTAIVVSVLLVVGNGQVFRNGHFILLLAISEGRVETGQAQVTHG